MCSGNHKIRPMKDLVMLGVDYSAGRPVDYGKNTERMASASDKASKILSLAKGSPFLLSVMRMHIQSGALYGARVNGISDKAFEKIRPQPIKTSCPLSKLHCGKRIRVHLLPDCLTLPLTYET